VSCDGFTAPLPEAKAPAGKTAGVAARYNALSNALKLETLPGQREHSISIITCDATVTHNESSSWILASMNVCLDGVTFKLDLATEQSDLTPSSITDVASGIRVMVHVPRLGTWLGFNVFSILSYFESLREALGEGQQGKLKVVNAPMPCKVLSVLKKDGDKVKAGEKLMIVESMKMEISISAQTDGTFEAKVQELDAVDEGTALCVVE
jgi:acetyl/propionyl-CoA carboxylase alpha subunit